MSVPRHRRAREPLNQTAGTPPSEPTATGNAANPIERLSPALNHDDIARRAYQLFEERGRESGHQWEDWFRAEREL